MGKSILVITGDGGESYETWYAVHRMQEEGYETVVAAPAVRRLHLVMHDFEPGLDTYVERIGYGMESALKISDAKMSNFDAVMLIGGRAPEYLRNDEALLKLVRAFAEAGKWIFSICHGIQVLVAAGLVKDRKVTCYEHVRNEVALAGGKWQKVQAVRDGRMITAQTWQSHPEFYRAVMAALSE